MTFCTRHIVLCVWLFACSILAGAGCRGESSAEKLRRAGFDPASRAVSFSGIADALNSLDQSIERVDYTRDPPEIVVDATLSTDKQPVLAALSDRPEAPGDFSYLFVPKRNVNFHARGVKPGDIVQFDAGAAAGHGDVALTSLNDVHVTVREAVDEHTLRITAPDNPLLVEAMTNPAPIIISRTSDRRRIQIQEQLQNWYLTGVPAVGWEPTPDVDALDNLVARLNVWLDAEGAPIAWEADPMVAALPEADRAYYRDLDARQFARQDGRLLQEAVWLRDIARRASGADSAEGQATKMFEWVVGNIELQAPEETLGVRQRPWQALATGRGTADERAWIFVLLLRQLQIDAVALAIADEGRPPRVWAVAAHSGDDWLLYEPALGVPIPGKGGGVATLADAKADDATLRRLDLADARYPLSAEDARRSVALVEASPLALSRRARQAEMQLAGAQRVVLAASPSRTAEAIRPHVAGVRLWPIQRETAEAQSTLSSEARRALVLQYHAFASQPYLWKGRTLQFKANRRRAERDYADRPVSRYSESLDARVYYAVGCRPADAELAKLNPAQYPVEEMRLGKQLATLWLGHIALEDGDYAVALDFFANRADRESPLADLARFDLAQTHEKIAAMLDRLAGQFAETAAAGELDAESWLPGGGEAIAGALSAAANAQRAKAAAIYQADDSPQRHGNRLRAKWLKDGRAEA